MKYEDIGVIENKMEVPSYTINEEKTYFSNQVTFAEPQPERMNLNILQNNLGNCLQIIDDEVMKGYVTRLDQLPIIIQDEEIYDNLNDIHFFKISVFIIIPHFKFSKYNKKERRIKKISRNLL